MEGEANLGGDGLGDEACNIIENETFTETNDPCSFVVAHIDVYD